MSIWRGCARTSSAEGRWKEVVFPSVNKGALGAPSFYKLNVLIGLCLAVAGWWARRCSLAFFESFYMVAMERRL